MSCRMLTTIITTKRGENKQLSDPHSLFAASVSTRCARRDRPEAGCRPRYRKFESISLQRGVGCELEFRRFGAKPEKVVEDRDRDLERHHPVVPPADQQDARPDAGEVRRVHAGFMPGCALSSR